MSGEIVLGRIDRARAAWPVVAVAVSACASGPRYENRSPVAAAPSGCAVDAAEVRVTSSGSTTSSWANPPKRAAMGEAATYNALTIDQRGTHVSRGGASSCHRGLSPA